MIRLFPLIPAKAGTQSFRRHWRLKSKNWIPAFAGMSGLVFATAALAGPVTLRANPVDDDGRVTLGDLFDGAGSAGGTLVANRVGPSVVFDAGQLQAMASRSGLQWANPSGLRRVVVREGSATPSEVIARSTPVSTTAPRPATTVAPGSTTQILTYARNLATGDVVQPEDVVWATVQSHLAQGGAPGDPDQIIGLSARRALRAGAAVGVRDLVAPRVIARNDMVEVAFVSGGVTLTITGRATRDAAVGEAVPVLNIQSGRTVDAVASGPGRALAGPDAHARAATPFASR